MCLIAEDGLLNNCPLVHRGHAPGGASASGSRGGGGGRPLGPLPLLPFDELLPRPTELLLLALLFAGDQLLFVVYFV